MFDNLVTLGYGIIVFAILVGVGTVVLYNLGGSVSICHATTPWNATAGGCYNATSGTATDPTGAAWTNVNYMTGQLGQSGLSGWTPAIIAISVGLLFLGAFLVGGKKGRY